MKSFLLLLFFSFVNSDIITLSNDNHMVIRGPISEESVNSNLYDLYKLNTDPIYIYIVSNGGSVNDGNKIIRAIDTLQKMNKTISCIADEAYSMAFTIFQSCTDRFIMLHSIMMQHQISLAVNGNIDEIERDLRHMKILDEYIINQELKRIKMDKNTYLEKLKNDWWVYDEDIIKYGLADKMVNVICDRELLETNYIVTDDDDNMVIYSKCPLIKGSIG